MSKIKNIIGRQILDSRGNPTVEADVILESKKIGRASVPSGASTGSYEAYELRDNDSHKFQGKGVLKAVENINTKIKKALIGQDAHSQEKIDKIILKLDGTDQKKNLGANAILAVSLATAKAAAADLEQEFFEAYGGYNLPQPLPVPLINIINGGMHAAGSTDIQEYMIVPVKAKSFSEAIQISAEVFHTLKEILKNKNYSTTVGDEGGFAPAVKGNEEPFELIMSAIEKAGHSGKFKLAVDVASSEFYADGKYSLNKENKKLTSEEMIDWLSSLVDKYPIISIEDGLAEDDWAGWEKMTEKLGSKIQLVGDDLLVTNTKLLEKAINKRAGNAILIKPNQIGTLTETKQAIEMAHKANWRTVMSHRSGETEDTSIADLAVREYCLQLKAGSLSRTDRVAKYNRMLRIEEHLGKSSYYAGEEAFTFKPENYDLMGK